MRLHRFLAPARHGVLSAVLVCILLVRTAVPAGWMPMASADGGIVLAPCSGMGAMTMAAHAMPGMQMPGIAVHHADDTGGDRHHGDPSGDHPCSGAGVSVALDTPFAIVPVVFVVRPAATVARAFVVGIGRGLAAPPPPQTGPPLPV